ncbi:MAG TPA: hypothetical protein VGP58_12785 [Pyrinomonadaceae bacterium]|nr:hypothetical protein [Pyrinomonadaceae bacterium]
MLENYTNLSSLFLMTSLIASSAALGIGLVIALRLLPTYRRTTGRKYNTTPAPVINAFPVAGDEKPSHGQGRLRKSEILGFDGGLLRYRDGSFGRAYRITLANTIYQSEEFTENRVDEISSLLNFDKPAGTIIQIRFDSLPDAGGVLRNHLRCRNEKESHPHAALLQATNLKIYEEAISDGLLKEQSATVWIRVPAIDSHDHPAILNFLPSVFREIERGGFLNFLIAPVVNGKNAFSQNFVRREKTREEKCRRDAEKVFRSFEENFPKEMRLGALGRQETFEILLISHRRAQTDAPVLSETVKRVDIRRYLAASNIKADDTEFVIHEQSLASVVSLKTPPQNFVTADTMRYLTCRGDLNFPHTIVLDFVALDVDASKKELKKKIKRIEGSGNTFFGLKPLGEDAKVIREELTELLRQVEKGREKICQARINFIVFGGRARNRAELNERVETLSERCEQMISAVRKIPGADAVREEPARVRAIYPRMLAGELSWKTTGQEFGEAASSLAAFVPTEGAWRGSPRPHSLFLTPDGQMFGLDLFDRNLIKSPTVIITAASGEGKSVLGMRIITDILAHVGRVKVRAIDYKNSLKPMCKLFGGRHINFAESEPKPLNIWNYPGIETGLPATKRQSTFVLTDLLNLSKTPKDDTITYSIAKLIVDEVYKISQTRNGAGRPKFQPTLSHFLDLLRSYSWNETERTKANELFLKLNIYRNDVWLDAPTHADFDSDSPFDVYELTSLSCLDEPVRESMGFRIAASIMQEIGEENSSGQITPFLFVCDEMKEITKHFPAILDLIGNTSLTGRKEGVVTLLMGQAYEHFSGTEDAPNPIGIDLVKNSGVKIIGKQIGNFDRLVRDCELSKETQIAVRSIRNPYGIYTQWVMVIGSGDDKIVEMATVSQSPIERWNSTTDANERNTRASAERLMTNQPFAFILAWLASKYPLGLTAAGLTEISAEHLEELQAFAAGAKSNDETL